MNDPIKSLFEEIVSKGIPFSSHCSDLYIPVTAETIEILKRYPLANANKTTFANQVEGGRWFDIPFNYDPAWLNESKG